MSAIRAEIAEIARKYLGIETLDAQGRDRLDFHDLHVERIRRALEAAYEAGRRANAEPPKAQSEGGAAR